VGEGTKLEQIKIWLYRLGSPQLTSGRIKSVDWTNTTGMWMSGTTGCTVKRLRRLRKL
jgi:hypothetical protein